MFFLIHFLFFTLTYSHRCSNKKYEHTYLCREKLNPSTLRVSLHLKFNRTTVRQEKFFSYYSFTLRLIDLSDGHNIHLEERFEKRISDYAAFNLTKPENNTIDIRNLPPGRYEVCVNFLHNKTEKLYY